MRIMRDFENLNPFCSCLFLLSAVLLTALFPHPALVALSLVGSVALFVFTKGTEGIKTHICFFILFIVMAAINPLFNHNGLTVLFVLNDNPVTLETLLFGLNSSAMIVSALYWFASFSEIMTSDRLLYLLSGLSPKASLIISMALRYVPLFLRKKKEISQAGKGMGIFKDDNLPDRIKGHMGVFSALVTFGLENGIITADSMDARGYYIGKRSRFSNFSFRRGDLVFSVLALFLVYITLVGGFLGKFSFDFYPSVLGQNPGEPLLFLSAFGTFVLLPVLLNIKEELKWRKLRRKI